VIWFYSKCLRKESRPAVNHFSRLWDTGPPLKMRMDLRRAPVALRAAHARVHAFIADVNVAYGNGR
jgi:hypothetical protein